jgi:hypothetical protein
VRPYSDWGVVSVRTPVWIPQNSTPTQQDDPRAHLLPVNIPNGVSIDANIATARAAYDSFSLKGGSEPGAAEARASMLNYNRLEWFNSMVQDKGLGIISTPIQTTQFTRTLGTSTMEQPALPYTSQPIHFYT